MFDGRIYRAAFAPLLLVVVVVGFALTGGATPLRSTLAPDAFDGARAYGELRSLIRGFPDRRPGSAGDAALAAYVARAFRQSTGGAGGGFQVSTRRFGAETAEGSRTLTTVTAVRPGSTGMKPIAIIAHRDAVSAGSPAELSGTAALLELARVFAESETRRTIVLVSTSGGSEGDAGASDYARSAGGLDAAIALGDLAGQRAHKPFVLAFSGGTATAPGALSGTVEGAISQEVGAVSGAPGFASQLAHLVFPLATGEQAALEDGGTPAVLVQASGERAPSADEPVSETRLSNFGRAVLSATYALDEGPDVPRPPSTRLSLGRKALPVWAIRLLVLALLLPPLLVCVDALARLRRRREPIGRWLLLTLGGALPFLTVALFAVALGALGIVAAPAAQLPVAALSADGSAPAALVAALLVLALGLLAWPALVRRLGLASRPRTDAAGLAPMLVLLGVALVVWLFDPFAALLLVPAAHLWLLAADPRARSLAAAALAAASIPIALLLLAYARELGLGPLALGESVVLSLAGGRVGVPAALLWSLALGCVPALIARALALVPSDPSRPIDRVEIATRGPLSYAGPGSLGGTESALRR
jgi:hypothetical protein